MAVTPQKFFLYKRLNGVYYLGFYDNGRRRWKSTRARRKPDALKALSEFRRLLKHKARPVTLRAFINDFLPFAEATYSTATVDMYNRTLRYFSEQTGEILLQNITSKHIDDYKAKRLNKIKPVSVNIEIRTLRAAFNTAKRWTLVEGNPCSNVAPSDVSEEAPPYLSPEDFQRLISCIREGWLKEIVVFAVLTGMRRSEIINLHWKDVDLKRRVVHIQTSPTFKTKNGKRRTIPLNDTAIHLLSSKLRKTTSEFVFTLNDKQIYDDWAGHLFKRYVRRANLSDGRLHFHSLRHTFASWLVQDGVSIYEVQKLLGHSNIAVTQVYSHLQPEQLHDTVNKIVVSIN